jgi:hypothetical protein
MGVDVCVCVCWMCVCVCVCLWFNTVHIQIGMLMALDDISVLTDVMTCVSECFWRLSYKIFSSVKDISKIIRLKFRLSCTYAYMHTSWKKWKWRQMFQRVRQVRLSWRRFSSFCIHVRCSSVIPLFVGHMHGAWQIYRDVDSLETTLKRIGFLRLHHSTRSGIPYRCVS